MTACAFFPFTHITAGQSKILGAFFRDVRVLDIDGQVAAAQGKCQSQGLVSCPLSFDRTATLDRQLADYMAWAGIHKGNEKNLKHLLRQTPYFKSDTDVTSIRTQIVGDEDGGDGTKDPGLFLKLAQNLDRETEAIDTRLSDLDAGRKSLLSELKGELGSPIDSEGPAIPGPDPGRIMPAERVTAWAALAREAGMFIDDSPVLVTTSPQIFAWVEEKVSGVINGLDIDSIKVHENGCENKDRWLQDVDNFLGKMTTGSLCEREQGDTLKQDSGCCHLSGYLKVRLFPGEILNSITQIPGRQVAVCLVGLNS